jgi:hypothetical protein
VDIAALLPSPTSVAVTIEHADVAGGNAPLVQGTLGQSAAQRLVTVLGSLPLLGRGAYSCALPAGAYGNTLSVATAHGTFDVDVQIGGCEFVSVATSDDVPVVLTDDHQRLRDAVLAELGLPANFETP